MEKESSTASILALFLVAPLLFFITAFTGAMKGALVLWGLSLMSTAVLQGCMSATRKEGRISVVWTFIWFFAQLLFGFFLFWGAILYLSRLI